MDLILVPTQPVPSSLPSLDSSSKSFLAKDRSVPLYLILGAVFSALDLQTKETVALKIEKPHKSKHILALEYVTLKRLQGLPHICPVYEFLGFNQMLGFQGSNGIVMKMLGKNLETAMRQGMNHITALELLVIQHITLRRKYLILYKIFITKDTYTEI
jgi:hypothetical protein